MKFACQVNSSFENLPRLLIDAEFLHDAMNHYCERFGLNPDEIEEFKPNPCDGTPYWMEHEETYEDGDAESYGSLGEKKG